MCVCKNINGRWTITSTLIKRLRFVKSVLKTHASIASWLVGRVVSILRHVQSRGDEYAVIVRTQCEVPSVLCTLAYATRPLVKIGNLFITYAPVLHQASRVNALKLNSFKCAKPFRLAHRFMSSAKYIFSVCQSLIKDF